MHLPEDVKIYLGNAFASEELDEALRVLGQARIEDGSVPNPHLLRCAAVASGGNLRRLENLATLLAVDWRDVIMAGEYEMRDKLAVRVRDLSGPLHV